MDSHASGGTWKLVDLPPGAKTIGCGWVFQLKHNADGSIVTWKSTSSQSAMAVASAGVGTTGLAGTGWEWVPSA